MADWYEDPARVAALLRSQPYADVVQTLVEDGSIALSIADLVEHLAQEGARLSHALRIIAEHARLDVSERGIAECERYAIIAEDSLRAATRTTRPESERSER